MKAILKADVHCCDVLIPAKTVGKVIDMPSAKRLRQMALFWSRARYSRKYVVMQFPKVKTLVLILRSKVVVSR